MSNIKIKIISKSGQVPEYKTPESAGMDLCACIDEPVCLKPMERKLIPLGIFVEFPKGYEAQIRARSGIAIKNGVGLVNGTGTIDSDYRGEWKVPLINWGSEDFIINNGDRIAQAIFVKFERADIELVEEINDTQRGKGGFGHTGVK